MTNKRIRIIFYIFFAIFLGLAVRLAIIQFISAGSLSESAFRQKLSSNSIEKLRGNILDRNFISFTNREERYTALIKPSYMPNSVNERNNIFTALDIDPETSGKLTSKSKPFMIETDKLGSDAIKKMKPDWVTILHSLNRYDSGTLAKHVIGYLNRKDKVGQAGLEKAYDKELQDNLVYEIGTITDAAKNPIKGLGYRIKKWGGNKTLDIKLTLDYHIQKIVEAAMDNKGISGAVVVEDVITGDILAMASRPDFDQGAVEEYLGSTGKELFNKATAAYNLGSVFKIIDMAAFYENAYMIYEKYPELYTEMLDYNCTGAVNINGLTFKCSSYLSGGHGQINLEQAFAKSCNSYFIDLCLKIGYRNLVGMAQKFGLGEETGISGQGVSEAKGSLPLIDSYYSQADIANLSIGQGVLLATPLQVADIAATVANGGIKNRINLVDSIVDEDGKTVQKIRIDEGHRIISKSTADKIKGLMEAVTLYGTGIEAGMEYYGGAGGKTGSAETGSRDVVHAWFAGYFPTAEPRYAIAVFVENGQLGGKAAAPIFSEIAREMKDKGY